MTCCRHPREDSRSILVRHVRHARFPRDMLVNVTRMLQGCYEETATVEFKLYQMQVNARCRAAAHSTAAHRNVSGVK